MVLQTTRRNQSRSLCTDKQCEPIRREDLKILRKMNDKAATVEGDLPVRVIKEFAEDLASPLSHLISESLAAGNYPNLWHI